MNTVFCCLCRIHGPMCRTMTSKSFLIQDFLCQAEFRFRSLQQALVKQKMHEVWNILHHEQDTFSEPDKCHLKLCQQHHLPGTTKDPDRSTPKSDCLFREHK